RRSTPSTQAAADAPVAGRSSRPATTVFLTSHSGPPGAFPSMRPLSLLRPLALVTLLALPAAAQRVTFSELTRPLTTNYQAAIGHPLTSGGFDFYNAAEFSPAGGVF